MTLRTDPLLAKGIGRQYAGEIIAHEYDFSACLGAGETLTGTPANGDVDGLTITSVAINADANAVTFLVTSEAVGEYVITLTVNTTGGQKLIGKGRLTILA